MAATNEQTKVLVIKLERPNWEYTFTTNIDTTSEDSSNYSSALYALAQLFWYGNEKARVMLKELCQPLCTGAVYPFPATTMTIKEYPYVSQETCHAPRASADR